jgi:hypothetical protein
VLEEKDDDGASRSGGAIGDHHHHHHQQQILTSIHLCSLIADLEVPPTVSTFIVTDDSRSYNPLSGEKWSISSWPIASSLVIPTASLLISHQEAPLVLTGTVQSQGL